MENRGSITQQRFALTDEHMMLLRIRDTLYEGSWEDFAHDLKARASDRPHVFETVPASPRMRATISTHLDMIARMDEWESRSGRRLAADPQAEPS